MIGRLVALLLLPASLALAAETYDPSLDARRYEGCLQAIAADPVKVEKFAIEWQALGGGLPARHCLALAQLAQEKNGAAAQTLVKAAQAAEAAKSPMAADFWSQAGNAALLAGEARPAADYFGAAILAQGTDDPAALAAMLVDRARAKVELDELTAAGEDLRRARKLDDSAVDGWLLSAALARRQQDLPTARAEIARARELAPDDADVLLESGNVAAASGDTEAARGYWQKAVIADPEGESARLARAALDQGVSAAPARLPRKP